MSGAALQTSGRWTVGVSVALLSGLLAFGLVFRLSTALSPASPEVRESNGTGTVSMATDTGEPLFADVILEPGQAVSACLRVTAATSGVNEGVSLDLVGVGMEQSELADRIRMTVERGTGTFATGNGSCRGFVTTDLLLNDRLAALGATPPTSAWEPTSGVDETWFRFTARFDADVPQSMQGVVMEPFEMRWRTDGTASGPVWVDRASVLLAAVTQRAGVPIMILLAIGAGFIRLQSFLSTRSSPESATREARPFKPPSLA